MPSVPVKYRFPWRFSQWASRTPSTLSSSCPSSFSHLSPCFC